MWKKFLSASFIAIACAAVASGAAEGTVGKGKVQGSEFDFRVMRVPSGNRPLLLGTFTLEQSAGHIRYALAKPTKLDIREHSATFSGKAIRETTDGAATLRTSGLLTVTISDERTEDSPKGTDHIQVRFEDETHVDSLNLDSDISDGDVSAFRDTK